MSNIYNFIAWIVQTACSTISINSVFVYVFKSLDLSGYVCTKDQIIDLLILFYNFFIALAINIPSWPEFNKIFIVAIDF